MRCIYDIPLVLCRPFQEITMENHQLLNSLEQLKPMISTRDLLKRSAQNQRYVVNASHSLRKAGGYDHLIQQYRKETMEAREAQLRRYKSEPNFAATAPDFGTGFAADPMSAGEAIGGASLGSASSTDKPRKAKPN